MFVYTSIYPRGLSHLIGNDQRFPESKNRCPTSEKLSYHSVYNVLTWFSVGLFVFGVGFGTKCKDECPSFVTRDC